MNRKALSTLLLLLLTGMVFVGCGRDQEISRVTAPTVSRPGPAAMNVDLDNLTYEVFSGTLYPGQDGLLNATMTTWGKNCIFSLVVPSSSTDTIGTPINFTMRIPTKQSYFGSDSTALKDWMIIRLAPDGYEFSGPITVTGTWMPWRGEPPDSLWVYYPGGTDSVLATITPVPPVNPTRWRVTYQVNHFSDWETGPGPRDAMP